ncbi:hypothetical protein ACJQWK_01164 [Exserohilum turcicum]
MMSPNGSASSYQPAGIPLRRTRSSRPPTHRVTKTWQPESAYTSIVHGKTWLCKCFAAAASPGQFPCVMMYARSPSWFVLSSKATADISYEALLPTVILTALASVMVVLRWCSRVCSRSITIGPEDYCVTAAMVFSAGFTAVVGREFSIDVADLRGENKSPTSLSIMLKLVLAQAILYHLASNLVKTSLILQYIRLFSHVPSIVCICYALFILVLGATAWGVFGNVFLCDPVQSYWEMTTAGTCMDKEQHFWSTSVIGIVLDVAIWVLPIPVIGQLKLPRRQKTGLLVVFGLGGVVCIVTIVRLVLVQDAMSHGQVTRCGSYAIIFSSIEINIAIICASLLVMKPLFARFLPYVVSEQPLSAAEDGRTCRALTGMHLLSAGIVCAAEKRERGGRNDTVIEMGSFS